VSHRSETPFDNLDNSHQYIAMLSDAISEAQTDVDAQIRLAESEHAERRREALQLVAYNLIKLNTHITSSRRVLNDLRSLRRLLLEERTLPYPVSDKTSERVNRAGV
jgi:hypothetical protein